MAIGWLAILKAVPWVEMARNAPEIAENAKRLWSTVARKPQMKELEVRHAFTTEDQEITWLKQKLSKNEAAYKELHNQMLTTSEIIKALADQNSQLIKSLELFRKRMLRLVAFTITIGIIAVYCLARILLS